MKLSVRRDEAVRAVCEKLTELIKDVICQSRELDSHGDEELRQSITSLETKIRTLTQRIGDLYELSGVGSDEDRKEVLSKIRAVQTERANAQADLAQWNEQLAGTLATLTPEDVGEILADFRQLLEDGAAGKLGEEAVHKAVEVFRLLTGGQIFVHVERRPGRKRTNVRGVFRPCLLQAVTEQSGHPGTSDETAAKEVPVWLRKPPRLDAIAEQVRELIDIEGQSYREAAKTLRQEGHNVNSGNVWYSYRRWYEMRGLPVPEKPYNNGKPRKSR